MLKMILSNLDSDSWSTCSSQLWKQNPTEIIHHNTELELPSSALRTICGTKSGKCLLFAYAPLDRGCFCCHQVTAIGVAESKESLWKWIVRPGYNIWQIQSMWKMWDHKHILWKFSQLFLVEWTRILGAIPPSPSSHGPEIVLISNVFLSINEKPK